MLKLTVFTSLIALVCGNIFINPHFYYKESLCRVKETENHYCYIYLPENFNCLNLYSDYDAHCQNFRNKYEVPCWYREKGDRCILYDNKTQLMNYINNEKKMSDVINYEVVKNLGLIAFIFITLVYFGRVQPEKLNTA
jgi:hypothetical protein